MPQATPRQPSSVEPVPGPPRTLAQRLIVAWALGGVLLLFGQATWRMTTLALEPLATVDLNGWHIALYAASIAFMGYTEGYRGFQQRFSPRAVKRAFHLAQTPRAWLILLAPAYSMGLVYATRARLVASWLILLMVIGFIIALRMTPQPWRGIVDAGVAVGLSWGAVAIAYYLVRGLSGQEIPGSADLPVSESPGASSDVNREATEPSGQSAA